MPPATHNTPLTQTLDVRMKSSRHIAITYSSKATQPMQHCDIYYKLKSVWAKQRLRANSTTDFDAEPHSKNGYNDGSMKRNSWANETSKKFPLLNSFINVG